MAINEKSRESRPDAASEKPRVKPDERDANENASEGKAKVDSIGEAPQESPEEIIADFFSLNESRLGYKSRLTLAIRRALVGLEYEASRETGFPVERLRAEFLAAQTGRQVQFEELRVREYAVSDYRVFLIFYITLIRRRSGAS